MCGWENPDFGPGRDARYHFVMKSSRPVLAAALSSALLLSACSGGEVVEEPTGVTTPDASVSDDVTAASADDGAVASTAADASLSTTVPAGDDAADTTAPGEAAATSAPGDDAATTEVAMTTDEETAAMPLAEAEQAAATVLTARAKADQGDGEDVKDLQRKSLMGNARKAHVAADRLEAVTGEPAKVDLKKNPVEPNVLAVSRDDGELPILLLVQTVPADGIPVLHLLESRTGEAKDFRISWEAPMLPGTTVPTFDRRSVGSPVVRSGKGDLATSPRDLLKSVASYISYPQPEKTPDYRTHGYAPAVRDAAEAQAGAVAGQATLREKNWLVSEDTKTLLFEDGSAFVMGTLLRDTQFQVDSGATLTPPDSFRVFQDSGSLSSEAVLRTVVFVGMRAPAKDAEFKPEMIAAREQLIDAWGS